MPLDDLGLLVRINLLVELVEQHACSLDLLSRTHDVAWKWNGSTFFSPEMVCLL